MVLIILFWLIVNAVVSASFDSREMVRLYLTDQTNMVRIVITMFLLPAWSSKVLRAVINWVIK